MGNSLAQRQDYRQRDLTKGKGFSKRCVQKRNDIWAFIVNLIPLVSTGLRDLRKCVLHLQICIKDGEGSKNLKLKMVKSFLIEETAHICENRCKESRKCQGNYGWGTLSRIQGHVNCKTRGNFIEHSF